MISENIATCDNTSEGWVVFGNKRQRIGNGYMEPDARFWLGTEIESKNLRKDITKVREIYNEIMPIEQPALMPSQIGYSQGEYVIKESIAKRDKQTLLDIGCANGRFGLALLRDKLILSLVGIDISDEEIKFANKTKENVGIDAEFYRSDIESFEAGCNFGIITMNQTLEHLWSPYSAIKKIVSDLLIDNGLFAGTVPYLFACNCTNHLHYFTISSLTEFLNKFFVNIRIELVDYYANSPDHDREDHLVFICKEKK